MRAGTAARPWLSGRAHHLPCAVGDLPGACLLPGDPARVDKAAAVLADFRILGQNREFRVGVGNYEGTAIGVCSTGIGGPSTEIAVVELQQLGVGTVIRTGGMGALTAGIAPGDVCVVSRAVREGGAAREYLDPDSPAAASPVVAGALRERSSQLGHESRDITVLSTDSYYLAQGRPLPGFEDRAAARMEQVAGLGVDAMDMECETVLAVGAAMGLQAGAVLVAHGSRMTDTWLENYEDAQVQMLQVAAAAAKQVSA